MNRNVTILVIVLVIILMAGYLVWLRSRFQTPQTALSITPNPIEAVKTPTPTSLPSPTLSASPSATASPSGKPSPTPSKSATNSAKTNR